MRTTANSAGYNGGSSAGYSLQSVSNVYAGMHGALFGVLSARMIMVGYLQAFGLTAGLQLVVGVLASMSVAMKIIAVEVVSVIITLLMVQGGWANLLKPVEDKHNAVIRKLAVDAIFAVSTTFILSQYGMSVLVCYICIRLIPINWQLLDLYLKAGFNGVVMSGAVMQLMIISALQASEEVEMMSLVPTTQVLISTVMAANLLANGSAIRHVLVVSTIANGILVVCGLLSSLVAFYALYAVLMAVLVFGDRLAVHKQSNMLVLGGIPPAITSQKYLLIANGMSSSLAVLGLGLVIVLSFAVTGLMLTPWSSAQPQGLDYFIRDKNRPGVQSACSCAQDVLMECFYIFNIRERSRTSRRWQRQLIRLRPGRYSFPAPFHNGPYYLVVRDRSRLRGTNGIDATTGFDATPRNQTNK